MRMRITAIAACLLLAGAVSWGEVLSIENDALRVDLDGATGLFQATDKASGQSWSQQAGDSAPAVESVARDGETLVMKLNGGFPMQAVLSLTPENELMIAVNAGSGQEIGRQGLAYPAPLVTPSTGHFVVWPDSEGVLIPAFAADGPFPRGAGTTAPLYNMGGLIMSWAGVTDPDLKSGYLMIVDTPYDASIRLVDTNGALSFQPVWNAEKGNFGYARAVRYRFLGDGGYVAQAKHYREYLQKHREFLTLKEKARTRPAIDKLIGAVQIYTWNDGRDLDLARELKDSGIEKAWIGWDPSHPPNPEPGYAEGLKELGYLAGVYDLYRDIYDGKEWEAKAPTDPILSKLIWHRYYYPGIFEDVVAIRPDGSRNQIRVSGDVGLMRYTTCDKAMVPHLDERFGREYKIYPYDAVFVDVTLAAGPIECYSEAHPMNHRENIEAKKAIHKYFADNYGAVVGSEWGADYGVPVTEFMHGVMTLHNYSRGGGPGGRGAARGAAARGAAEGEGGARAEAGARGARGSRGAEAPPADSTPTPRPPAVAPPEAYEPGAGGGSWANTQRPTMVLGESLASDALKEFALGAQYRIPLYELVHHDCTVSSWRWDENTHKVVDVWDTKTLFEILYGTAPQWNLDETMWARHKDKFVSTYKVQGPWLEKIGYDEMVNHEYLTPDRNVQQTTFSSGAKAIVNFGDTEYAAGEIKVAPKGYVLLGL